MNRRNFLGNSFLGWGALAASGMTHARGTAYPGNQTETRKYLERILYTREEVRNWIEGKNTGYIGERYDADIGWVHIAGHHKGGVDGSICEYSYEPSGARRMPAFSDRPCRVNTYGNSFTHCDQVSDGETWQERLAAHLCEPVRNFGVSGHSVYQAFVRMKREEARTPASCIILNIYSDDHSRNLYGWASIASPRPEGNRPALRRPTKPYVRANPATGAFEEFGNDCPTPESLYNLCDLDWVYDRFKDDFRLQILLAQENIKRNSPERSYEGISAFAKHHGIEAEIRTAETLQETMQKLYAKVAFYSSTRIVEKAEEFAAARGKKVLYVLSYTVADLRKALAEGVRVDQEFVDFLKRKGLSYVDDLEAHRAEFALFKSTADAYIARYYIGHYNPLGNMFQAFVMKDKLAALLDPRPIAYPAPVGQTSAGTKVSEKVVNPGKTF